MSETASAPSAPAAVPNGADSSPPPASQPALSVSEAARLLGQQRRQVQPQAAEAERAPREAAPPAATPAVAPATPAAADAALDTMARALGLEPGAAAVTPGDAAAPVAGIEIDGRRYTQEQLRAAVLQANDYTQKTQALAQQRQQIEAERAALATVLPYLQPELQRIHQQVSGVPRPDPALAESNPAEYVRQRAAYEHALDEQSRLGQLTTLQQQAQERALADEVARSNEVLAQQFPQWADPATRAEWQGRIAEWAMNKAGFQKAELQRLSDHRQLVVMMKAMQFDNLLNGAKTAAPQQARPARGAAPPPAPAGRVADAETAFDSAPNIRNAAALLAARRANGR